MHVPRGCTTSDARGRLRNCESGCTSYLDKVRNAKIDFQELTSKHPTNVTLGAKYKKPDWRQIP